MVQDNFGIGKIETWVESLDREAVITRIEEIEVQITSLMEEGRRLHAALDFKEKWDEARSDGRASPNKPMRAVPEAHFPLDGGPPPQGKTDAALRVLGSDPDREWSTPDIAEQMIMRDWMENSESDHASLASTLSRLFSENRIFRPQRGRYQLAPPKVGNET